MHLNPSHNHDNENHSITDEFEPDARIHPLPFINLYPHMYSKLSRPPLHSPQSPNLVDGPQEKDLSYPWSPETFSARSQANGWTDDRHESSSSLLDAHYQDPSNHVLSPPLHSGLSPTPDEAPLKTRLRTLFTDHTPLHHKPPPPKHTFRTRDPTTNEWHSYPSVLTTTSASSDADLFDPVAVKHSLAARRKGGRRCHALFPAGVVLLLVLCSPGILAYGWAEGRWRRWKRESGSHKRKSTMENEDEAGTGEKTEYQGPAECEF
jgi:hypothetical protein